MRVGVVVGGALAGVAVGSCTQPSETAAVRPPPPYPGPQIEGAVSYSFPLCVGGLDFINRHPMPVRAYYREVYKGEGPSPLCQASWTSGVRTVRLDRGGVRTPIGCTRKVTAGGLCVEVRSFPITRTEFVRE